MTFTNAISWVEIPASNLNRAQKFYEVIFGMKMTAMDFPNMKMRLFPLEDPMGVGAALVDSGGFHKPSPIEGPLVYLNANPNVQAVLDKVDQAGGRVLVPKTEISPDHGYMAVILDTEGNRIALHAIPNKK